MYYQKYYIKAISWISCSMFHHWEWNIYHDVYLPSVHLLQCSHCGLYHIAAMPARNQQNKRNIGLRAVFQTLFSRVIYISPPDINPLWSNPSLLFNCAKSLIFLWCAAEIVPEGTSITVITRSSIQSQSPAYRAEGSQRQREKWGRERKSF